METYRIAAMGADGIGPEVVEAAVQALKVCAERDGGFKLEFKDFDWGSDYYKKHGVMMPADGADQLGSLTPSFSERWAPGHPRPHHALGTPARDLPAARPVRQRPPDADPARYHEPAAARQRTGARLGHRARELGGRVLRRRRARP